VKYRSGPGGIIAGHQHSAHSWGTGRAVSRIPRVSGGGSHRSGQGAFGNMCRGGRIFSPTKTFRRWNRRININQKRLAIASCLAASVSAPLIEARGHRISENVNEIPIVLNDIEKITGTKLAFLCMKKIGLFDEIKKCKRINRGRSKMRNRKYKKKEGAFNCI